MSRKSCSRSCTTSGSSASTEFARFDREECGARGPAGGDPRGEGADPAPALGGEPDGHHDRLAGALGGLADVAREDVVAERARNQVEQVLADQLVFLAEVLLARLAHRAEREVVGDDHEGGAVARHRVAVATQHHAHPAAVAYAAAALEAARGLVRGVATAGAEADGPGPLLSGRGPIRVNA